MNIKAWLKKYLAFSDTEKITEEVKPKTIEIPKDWFVFECGQSPIHFLWYCHMIKLETELDGRRQYVLSEEGDTFEEVINNCIKQIQSNQISYHKLKEKLKKTKFKRK